MFGEKIGSQATVHQTVWIIGIGIGIILNNVPPYLFCVGEIPETDVAAMNLDNVFRIRIILSQVGTLIPYED